MAGLLVVLVPVALVALAASGAPSWTYEWLGLLALGLILRMELAFRAEVRALRQNSQNFSMPSGARQSRRWSGYSPR